MVEGPTYFSSSLPLFSLPPPVLSPLSILPSVLYLRLLLVSGSDRVNELQINGHDGFSWVHLLCSQVLHLLFWQALHESNGLTPLPAELGRRDVSMRDVNEQAVNH